MRIAFDLDGTLIPSGFAFATVSRLPKTLAALCGIEPLRVGAVALMRFMQAQGDEVWVYTTSYRRTAYIRILFLLHGIPLDGVVNQAVHDRQVKRQPGMPRCSKYPPAFGIDLLIDDQEGVLLEAQRHGFKTIWVKPDTPDWTRQVRTEYLKYKEEKRVS
jgi:FMN phosphatase YigB (HAD superfamily)